MRLFFCEKCGKRLDDRDLDSGAARDKKLKGVYCAECSVGVNTMVMQPISDADLRRAEGAKPPSDANLRRATPHAPHASHAPAARRRPAPHGAPARPEFETKRGPPAGMTMIFVGVGVLGFALLFLFRSTSSSSSSPGKSASATADERKSEPTARAAAKTESAALPKPPSPPKPVPISTKPPAVQKTADEAPATSPPKTEKGNPALEKERAAQEAFDKVLAETDPKKDKAQAVERMHAFVDAYPESVVAARGRSLLAEWSKPEAPPAPEPPPAAKTEVVMAEPPAKTEEVPATPAPVASRTSTSSGTWETLHESQFTGPNLDPFWASDGNADVKFADGAWRVDTSKQVRGKNLVTARSFPLDRAYRLTVVAGYRGDAPKQQLMVACFRAGQERFTGHGMQSKVPMVAASLSANTLSFQRMHQLKSWSRENLMKDEPLKEGEHTIVFEIGPVNTSLAVDGKERFSGAHGLKDAGEVKFLLVGIADTGPFGEEVWFRSVKLESASVGAPSPPSAVKWGVLFKEDLKGPELNAVWNFWGNAATKFENGTWRVDTSATNQGGTLVLRQAYALNRAYRFTVVAGYRGNADDQKLSVGVTTPEGDFDKIGRQNRAPMLSAVLTAGSVKFVRAFREKVNPYENLLKPRELKEGEHVIAVEIGPETTKLTVDDQELFSGPHGLDGTTKVVFFLGGYVVGRSKGEEVWIRSAKIEGEQPAGK